MSEVRKSIDHIGLPHWIDRALHVTGGRDPISLQTITTDRIMPRLAPAILALSRRARYVSIYLFLLDEFESQRRSPNRASLSSFIKEREFELAVAMQLCPHGCGRKPSAIVGQDRAGPIARRLADALPRGEQSVQSELGGYGLYYRTPLLELGLVAPAGTPFGDQNEPTPVDVLANQRAKDIADRYRAAIAETRYYREFFRSLQPIPRDVLEELAEAGCLCRLDDHVDEQAVIRSALLEPLTDGLTPAAAEERNRESEQRRRTFALVLKAVGEMPAVAVGPDPDAAFRRTIWSGFEATRSERTALSETHAQWAALIAKDVMQEALSSIWADLCRSGVREQPGDGMTPDELRTLIRHGLATSSVLDLPGGSIEIAPDLPTTDVAGNLQVAEAFHSLEELRSWIASRNTAAAGIVGLLNLRSLLPSPTEAPQGWLDVGRQGSWLQPALLDFAAQLDGHLASNPTFADTMQWIVHSRVIAVHESVAYGKLPEFTFRFRWELGRLRFYDNHPFRFGLTDIRRDAIVRISEDLGLWTREGDEAVVTPAGAAFIGGVFG